MHEGKPGVLLAECWPSNWSDVGQFFLSRRSSFSTHLPSEHYVCICIMYVPKHTYTGCYGFFFVVVVFYDFYIANIGCIACLRNTSLFIFLLILKRQPRGFPKASIVRLRAWFPAIVSHPKVNVMKSGFAPNAVQLLGDINVSENYPSLHLRL